MLYRYLKPFADWYASIAGYRQMGLKYDDLLIEEREDVKKALSRLSTKETYDRVYRLRRASQASVLHQNLPKEQWIKAEEDVRYLRPYVEDVHNEDLERAKWDTIEVQRKR